MGNAHTPAMPMTLVDSKCLHDILIVEHNAIRDCFELIIAYDNGNDSEMTFFLSKEDAKSLADALLKELDK